MEFVMNMMTMGDLVVVLWLHTDVDPPQEPWDIATRAIYACMDESPSLRIRGLVVSDGGAPNRKQRAETSDSMRRAQGKYAVVTTVLSNPFKRGVATALRLLAPGFAFYRPEDFAKALVHLDLPPDALGPLRQRYLRMQQELRPVKALAQIL